MAGQIKVDSINADSNLALKIANTTVAFIDSSGLRPVAGNLNLDATATSKFYLPSANTVAIQTAGVTGLSISSAQVVTLANALAVTSGGTGVTTSTGTGAVVLGTSPTIASPSISSAVMTTMASSVITSGTAVATTSGTSIDFTSIPSWVKRITVMLNGVSTNSTSKLVVRIGTGGTPTTSGYIAQTTIAYSSVSTSPETTGFPIFYDTASFTISGSMVIQNITGNNWVMSAVGSNLGGTAFNWFSGGNVSLAGVLNLVRLTTVNGTDTFDAGSVNILYE